MRKYVFIPFVAIFLLTTELCISVSGKYTSPDRAISYGKSLRGRDLKFLQSKLESDSLYHCYAAIIAIESKKPQELDKDTFMKIRTILHKWQTMNEPDENKDYYSYILYNNIIEDGVKLLGKDTSEDSLSFIIEYCRNNTYRYQLYLTMLNNSYTYPLGQKIRNGQYPIGIKLLMEIRDFEVKENDDRKWQLRLKSRAMQILDRIPDKERFAWYKPYIPGKTNLPSALELDDEVKPVKIGIECNQPYSHNKAQQTEPEGANTILKNEPSQSGDDIAPKEPKK
jgi:hypothetical protein